MARVILAGAAASLIGVSSSVGATLFSDDFTYSNGNLVGRGGWLQTGSTATSPLQVSNGAASLGISGQDIYSPLVSVLTLSPGTGFYYGLTINVSAAQATGDYFIHFTPTVGDSSSFFGRTFIKSSGAGFVLGYLEVSGGTANYGSTVLSFNTSYRLVVAYNSVSGTLNDTASLYVNPSNSVVEGQNSPYLSDTWTSATAEPAAIAALNLRQGKGGGSAAPTLTVDLLSAGDAFSSAAGFSPVPEPSTWALFGAGVIGLGFVFRLKAK